jgi:superoxide reductase
MTEQREVYKCEVCGNIVEVLHSGGGQLVCCGEPMKLMKENGDDKASKEKHVPIIKGNVVAVGSISHPMEEEHYIEWIEAERLHEPNKSDKKEASGVASKSEEGEVCKVFLTPDDDAESEFPFKVKSARAYCNLHGLWKSS